MKTTMGEMQDLTGFKSVVPDRIDACPVCGSDADLESAMIRMKRNTLGYAAGLVYHCATCNTAWPLCGEDEKEPIDDWVEFNEYYEGLE
jgi:formate dehydrogenase maturation protein FdhE